MRQRGECLDGDPGALGERLEVVGHIDRCPREVEQRRDGETTVASAAPILRAPDCSEGRWELMESSPYLTLWIAARVSSRAVIFSSTFGLGMLR
ncbi:MAG: hypothetical protein ACREU9_03555 [Gammaproteobacteria bacterium]